MGVILLSFSCSISCCKYIDVNLRFFIHLGVFCASSSFPFYKLHCEHASTGKTKAKENVLIFEHLFQALELSKL